MSKFLVKLLSARRAFSILYMVAPFLVFFIFVVGYWLHPDPTLTNPASSNFNEFEGPVDWTLTYSLRQMLPSLPFLIWPVPIGFWLYQNPSTSLKNTCVALSFLGLIIFIIFMVMMVALGFVQIYR